MVRHSAGIALWRSSDEDGTPEILLVHPGGPYWKGKNAHGWSIPKGEFEPDGESAEDCARREFAEELGSALPIEAVMDPLAVVKASGKHIHPFLVQGVFDPTQLVSNTTEIEWPPRSGERITIPEVDAAAWFRLDQAREYLHKGQSKLVELIADALAVR